MLSYQQGDPAVKSVDSGLALLVYLDDMASPRATVRLSDLLRQGGKRPLNLRRSAGQRVRIVLADPNGAWATAAPPIQVTLHWS
ncbi:MAG: Vault protein inter-alpha-trypsin [Armatimonadetes bacterium]|nr:Vault protein inter-alpha-trypsin [Armatimonadota bacterium]